MSGRAVGETVAAVLVLSLIAALVAHCLTGCGASQQAREVAAEGAYLAEQLACVDRHNTDDAITRCRDEVRRRWGIATRVRDGGSHD